MTVVCAIAFVVKRDIRRTPDLIVTLAVDSSQRMMLFLERLDARVQGESDLQVVVVVVVVILWFGVVQRCFHLSNRLDELLGLFRQFVFLSAWSR